MVALIMTVTGIIGLVIVANEAGADTTGFTITVILLGFGFAPFVGDSLERHIPSSLWDRLSFSRKASRLWGVSLFNTFLSRIGWNRRIIAMRGNRAAGVRIWSSRPMRSAAAGHTWAFLLHCVTTVWTCVAGGVVAPVILLLVGLIGHLYPVLLQVRVLTRLREVPRRSQ